MKIIEGLNYREWQKRNTYSFDKLNPSQQKTVRAKGYRNVGWDNVQKSWKILTNSCQKLSLFDHKLNQGDLLGAVNHSILEAEQAKVVANKSLSSLEKKYQKVQLIADKALAKYQTL
ncbi:MAG: hypothetical protein F6K45_24070 [Kamptonema sp. SIO1D9]|nr:hypothetical protein [Kamptonema sp. SIO1D9]